jgi:hypothetical protein
MLELMAVFAFLSVGAVLLGMLFLVGLALKLAFKIVLLPVGLVFGLLKVVLGGVFLVLGLLFAPLLLVALLVLALPLLMVGGLIWGIAAVAA